MTDELYAEVRGNLGGSFASLREARDRVVFSDIVQGTHVGYQLEGIGLKYVARGAEYYRFGDRLYEVSEGQFLCAVRAHPSQVEIRRRFASSTIGLCIHVAEPADDVPASEELLESDRPLIFSARDSKLGSLLNRHARLFHGGGGNQETGRILIDRLRPNLELLLEDAARQLDSLSCVKASTRFETLRRLHIARAYLNDVTGRRVSLAELSRIAGVSQFQLLRYFRDCFGEPPATYHRKLRLELARAAIEHKRLSRDEAARKFGFADSSGFSHSHRRAFGRAPGQRST